MTVYEPGEDSYLLKRWLEKQELEGRKVLDMGTGSGVLAVTAAEKGAEVTAVDINPEAVEEARQKAEEAGVGSRMEFRESDLFENIEGEFDLVVFNPPYLPGEEGIGDEEIWRGGEKGTEVTVRFLEEVGEYLTGAGKFAVVLSSRPDYREIVDRFDLEILDEKNLWFENLFVAVGK